MTESKEKKMVDFRPGVQEKTEKLVEELLSTVKKGIDREGRVRKELADLHPKQSIIFEELWTKLLIHGNGLRELYRTPYEFCIIDKLELKILKQLAKRAFLEKSL